MQARIAQVQGGITPAGAGKTLHRRGCTARMEDHPRRCGENLAIIPRCVHGRGSPPQVRGKPQHKKSRTVTSRITPAGAGKTIKR